MEGSYQLDSFTENRNSEVGRLGAQVDLFFEKEFEIYKKFGLKDGMKLVDLGSGPGHLLRRILKILPGCEATAIEIDPFLIKVLKEASFENNIKLFDVKHASIYDTQLPADTFDFAIARLVIEHLQSPLDAFKELWRVLKPGGKLVIVSNDFAYHLLTHPVIPELDEMYSAYCRSRFSEGGNPLIGRRIPKYLKKSSFAGIQFEVIGIHGDLVGDKAMLQAESVNISKSLVSEGFLNQETLDALAEGWYRMLKDPDHVIYRQLFAICGEKSLTQNDCETDSGKNYVNEVDKFITDNLSGLTKEDQEDAIRSFLVGHLKRIMMDEALIVEGDDKLCDIDIDSIAAADLSSLIQTNFQKTVSISGILQRYSLNDIIGKVLATDPLVATDIFDAGNRVTTQHSTNQELFEISSIQEQFWILQKLFPNNTAYNIPSALRIEGEINLSALEGAINHIIQRHEALRVSFCEKHDKVYQRIEDNKQLYYKIKIIDLQKSYDINSANEQILKEAHGRFDLTVWPLFRIKLFLFNNNISLLTIVFHHIIIDLQSRQLFERELAEFYNIFSSGEKVIKLPPASKYSEYSIWLNTWLSTDKAQRKKQEWKQAIPEVPEILEVAPDYPRPKVNNLAGKSKYFELDTNISMQVNRFARDHSVNSFTVLLAAYSIFLNRLSSKTNIIIGVPLTNRRKVEFSETFGCFVNIVPILANFHEGVTGSEILLQIRQSLLKANSKQEVPFLIINDLLRDNSADSILQAGFTFQPPMQLAINGLDIQSLVVEKEGAQLDLFFTMWEQRDGFSGYLEYSSQLFKEATAKRLIDIYRTIITSLIENPGVPTSEMDIISDEEARMIYEWNDSEHQFDEDLCIHQKFEQQVKKTPEAIALMGEGYSLTYRQLNEEANRFAHHLLFLGVKTEDKVAICLDRSIEMIISIYAILKTGAAYLPLNPEDPTERHSRIIVDARPALIITNTGSSHNLPVIDNCLDVDQIFSTSLSENTNNPDINIDSSSLAYIIFTSGSTGVPKGVMIEHRSVMNRLNWMQNAYPINNTDAILHKTPIIFDVSVWELFWWSFNGSRLVLLPKGGEKDPTTIASYIKDFNVSVIHFVPSMFSVFLSALKTRRMIPKVESLKHLFLSGEVLSTKLVQDFNILRSEYSLPKMTNLYGPTEATVDVSFYDCPNADVENVFIGRPIYNTGLYVANKKYKLQPIGIAGELIITGVNLARGYLNNPELTREKFVMFHVPHKGIMRGYLSGDLARLSASGELEYIGRKDNQVKIRGFRIELGDIENKLMEHPLVENCAVVIHGKPDERLLVAYVSLNQRNKIDDDVLKTFLKTSLPDYMVPSYFFFINTLPLNQCGKLDRKKLPEIAKVNYNRSIVNPTSKFEKMLLDLWKKTLKIEDISINDNFFDIGGNSLSAINLSTIIMEDLKIEMDIIAIFEYPTIKDLSWFLSKKVNKYASHIINDCDEKTLN